MNFVRQLAKKKERKETVRRKPFPILVAESTSLPASVCECFDFSPAAINALSLISCKGMCPRFHPSHLLRKFPSLTPMTSTLLSFPLHPPVLPYGPSAECWGD